MLYYILTRIYNHVQILNMQIIQNSCWGSQKTGEFNILKSGEFMSPVSPVFYTVVTVIETYPVLRPRLQALITYILSQAWAGTPIHRYLVMNDPISLTIGKFDLILRHHLSSCKKEHFSSQCSYFFVSLTLCSIRFVQQFCKRKEDIVSFRKKSFDIFFNQIWCVTWKHVFFKCW